MLLFEEVDRSFFQSWARPLLNLRAGLIDCLKPEVYPGWPPNLRLFFRCAPEETTLQCPEELIMACGAVQICLDESPQAPSPGEPPLDIASFPWVQWSQAGACPVRTDLRLSRLGAYHLCGSHDLARIRRLAALHSEDETTTDHFGLQVRIKWPSDYRRSVP